MDDKRLNQILIRWGQWERERGAAAFQYDRSECLRFWQFEDLVQGKYTLTDAQQQHLAGCVRCQRYRQQFERQLGELGVLSSVITVMLRKPVGKALELIERSGARFDEPQWVEPQWVPAMTPEQGGAEEEISEAELHPLILPIHTDHADIELKVQLLGEGQFNVILTFTEPGTQQGLGGCKVRWLVDGEVQDVLTTLADGVVVFRVGAREQEFLCQMKEWTEEVILKISITA